MRTIVAGGSAAGQFTAVLLARAGHEVALLDRDPIEPASDIEAAASAFRPPNAAIRAAARGAAAVPTAAPAGAAGCV